jgi:predicted DNA-binding transcriptional regulator AlpA
VFDVSVAAPHIVFIAPAELPAASSADAAIQGTGGGSQCKISLHRGLDIMTEQSNKKLAGLKLLSRKDLREMKGITFSTVQLWRLERQNKFPLRVRLSEQRVAWVEEEIDAWIKARMRERVAA